MLRVLIDAWGNDGQQYAGRRMTLYRDPDVVFGRNAVGGIRISHLSDIDKPHTSLITVTRGKRKPYTVQPLIESDNPWIALIEKAADLAELKSTSGTTRQQPAQHATQQSPPQKTHERRRSKVTTARPRPQLPDPHAENPAKSHPGTTPRDGWRATTIEGIYAGQDDKWIYIKKDGARLTFLRSRWGFVIA
jgi:hypothetical protein